MPDDRETLDLDAAIADALAAVEAVVEAAVAAGEDEALAPPPEPPPPEPDEEEDDPDDPVVPRVRLLERRIHSLPERAMRRAVLREVMLELDVDALVSTLRHAVARGNNGRGHARELLQELALEPTVFREMSYDTVQAAYSRSRAQDLPEVASMFLSARHEHNPTVDEAFQGNDYIDHPVGVRREWARGRDRDRLDRLLHDRDHRVVAHLLDNPRIIERDVVKVAAMRPTRPEVLLLIARHGRWSSRYPVRKALALNPYTPDPIKRRLLPTLMRQDLRQGLEAGVLSDELREEALRLLRSRRTR
ncbi:MAG: hypothetical protein H6742_13235 [Alphaproteobacteria bacterium]|nr:hypothetical protein [Alphaproteobacteria bacterium]